MKATVEHILWQAVSALQESGEIVFDEVIETKVLRTKDASHGNYATNIALVLAKYSCQSPKMLAELLVQTFEAHTAIERVEVADPGFINFFIKSTVQADIIATVLIAGATFGCNHLGQGALLRGIAAHSTGSLSVDSIQYAHARISSLLRQLEEGHVSWNEDLGLMNVHLLLAPSETSLFILLSRYPEVVQAACEPHQIIDYLRELAKGLHSYYNAVPLLCEQDELRSARLCLLQAVRQVLCNGVQLLGVSAPESM